MKKIMIPMLLAFCLLFSGCGKQETEAVTTPSTTPEVEAEAEATPSTTPETEEEAASSTTPEAEAETTPSATQEAEETTEQPSTEYEVPQSAAANAGVDYFTAYQSVFEDYETIFDGGWKADDYQSNDFPMQLIYCMGDSPYDNIGYTLVDLDNDGVQELLIGEASADPFYDCLLLQMYTLENGNVKKVLSSQESAWYQLCEDSTIALTDADSADVTHYTYSNGTLVEVTSDSPAQDLGCTAFSFYEQFMK